MTHFSFFLNTEATACKHSDIYRWLPSFGVERISTGTQTDDSCINDLLDHSFVSSIENDNNDESEESDLDWIPESDNEEQNDIHHDINPAKERKFIVFESCLDNLYIHLAVVVGSHAPCQRQF